MKTKNKKPYSLYLEGLNDYFLGNDLIGIRKMQQAMSDVLIKGEEIPEEMRHALHISFEMIVRGEKHYLFNVAGNRPPVSYAAEKCRNDAVRYIRTAKEIGSNYDKNPVNTISKHYDVTTKTVNRWVSSLKNDELKIIEPLNNKEFIKKIMLASARAYKKYSHKRGKPTKLY